MKAMKSVGKIAIWLAGGLALSAGAQADTIASADNPYTPIVTRNIFGLNAIQATETTSDPPPKITLNGIMSIYGKAQVLFKVAGTGKPGQPAKDQSYILSESQRQDDIEVMRIDDQANVVTFNNHGTVQEIPLAAAPVVTAAVPGPGGPGGQVPRSRFGRQAGVPGGGMGGNQNGEGMNRIGGGVGPNRGMGGNNPGQNSISPGMGGSSAYGGGSTYQSSSTTTGGFSAPQSSQGINYIGNPDAQSSINGMTPEQLAVYHAAMAESQGNSPAGKIWPGGTHQ